MRNENKGRSTYEFIPVDGTKVLWPKNVTLEFHDRMLLHDAMLKDYSYILAQLGHQRVTMGRIKNLYLIYFCTATDLLKPGLNWMIQLKTYIQMQSQIFLVWIKLR